MTAEQPRQAAPRFASFISRLGCVAADMFLALFVAGAIHDLLLQQLGSVPLERRDIMLLLLLCYFAACWASPMQGTLMQRLVSLRVVGEQGEALGPGRALARSALLVTLIAGALCLLRTPAEPALGIVAIASIVLLASAVVTRCRQAGHDLLVRSLVLKAATARSPAQLAALRAVVNDREPGAWRRGRPSVLSMAGNLALLLLLTALLHALATEHFRRDRLFRVNYALNETEGLREAVAAFHREHGRLPAGAGELGLPPRTPYPDGGYYELTDSGAIRIRFTETPELKTGTILLIPFSGSERFLWDCQVEGRIAPAYLPRRCRETATAAERP